MSLTYFSAMLMFCITVIVFEAVLNVLDFEWLKEDKVNERGRREHDQVKIFVISALAGIGAALAAALYAEKLTRKHYNK